MAVDARGNPARWWKSGSGRGQRCAPGSLFVSPFRRFATVTALLFFVLFFAGLWYITNPARVSRLSEVLLSRVLGGHVSVRTGRLSWSGTLLLSGVDVRTTDPEPVPGSDLPLFSADQIEVRFDWLSLFSGQLSATQLVATTPVFRPIEDRESGHWNYERLRPPTAGLGGASSATGAEGMGRIAQLPVVIIHDARVEWSEVRSGRVSTTGETIIDGRLLPDSAAVATYRFKFVQRVPTPATAPATRTGGAAGDVGVELSGTWDVANDVFIAGTENVLISDALKRGMPRQARDWCEEHQLSGRLSSMKIGFSRREGLTVAIQFDGVSMMFLVEPEQGIGMTEVRPAYPVGITDVRGSAFFSLADNSMKISNLRGQVLGYPFIADCALHGTSFDAPLEMNLQFPNAVLGDRYPPLFMAFLTSQDLMQRVQPHGKVDISLAMQREVLRGPMTVKGRINCHDVRIRFAHFPYPLEHLNGLITMTEQSVTFHNVTAQSDESSVTMNGTIGTVWNNPMIDFRVSSNRAVFDDRLGACLPEKFVEIWNMFSIRGSGGFECRVTRSNSFFDMPKVAVDVDVEEGTGFVKAMPYAFTGVKGRIHLEGDETRIENLKAVTGSDGTGRVTLNGIVRHPGGDVKTLSPELRIAADVPIEEGLLQALPQELSSRLALAKLGGRVGFEGTVRQNVAGGAGATQPALIPAAAPAGGAELKVVGTFKWTNGSMALPLGEIAVAAREITAEAEVGAQGIEIRSFAGLVGVPGAENDDALKVQAAGHLDLQTMAMALNIRAEGQNLSLPAEAPQELPADWRKTWADYSPRGHLDLTASLALHAGPTGSTMQATTAPATFPAISIATAGGQSSVTIDSYAMTIMPRGIRLQAKDWPEPMEAVAGTIEVAPGGMEMQKMAARVGVMDMTWSGRLDTTAPGGGRWSLSGDVESRGVPVKWLDRLPTGLAQSLDTKKEGSTLSLHVAELTRENGTAPWAFSATLAMNNLGLTAPLVMNTGRTNLVTRGTFVPAGGPGGAVGEKQGGALDFEGVLAGANVMVSDHLVETLTAHVAVNSVERALHISAVEGKVAQGSLQGKVDIYTEHVPFAPAVEESPATGPRPEKSTIPSGGFQAAFTLKDADLSHLVLPAKATDEERRTMGTAVVNASLSLEEVFGPGSERVGQGELILRNGNIYNVPLSMGLMQMVTLRLPVARSFRDGDMMYHIKGEQIRFDRILLESPGINLAGAGTISMSTKNMSLSFVTETPNEFSIPILTPIIQQTRNELLQLSVTGTVDTPKITPVPFSSISNALKALLPRQRAEERQ